MRSSSTSRVEAALRALLRGAALLVVALPVLALVGKSAARFHGELLVHLLGTVVPSQAALGGATALGAALLAGGLAAGGLGAALFDFPGRGLLDRALLVPLLLPTWFLAVVHREVFGARGPAWLTLVLAVGAAPLLHLLGGAALRALPGAYVDVLRLGGRGEGGAVARHLLPLALPALGGAAALGMLLSWADAPTARALAVPTLAVGMLDQWSAREDASAGALLGLVVAALSALVAWLLLRALAAVPSQDDARLGGARGRRVRLRGAWGLVPWLLAAPQLALGVLVPAAAIGQWTAARIDRVDLGTLGGDAARSLLLAVAGTALAGLLSLPLLHARALGARGADAAGRVALLCFALPATVLAVAVLWALPPALDGTLAPVVLALGAHHAAVFLGAGTAALQRGGAEHVAVLRTLGHGGLFGFLDLLRPFLGRALGAGAAFVFLECLKDVHLTVVLSPFGFQSISARVFQYAQTERTRDCAVWMLCLAIVGLYPLMTLARLGEPEEPPR